MNTTGIVNAEGFIYYILGQWNHVRISHIIPYSHEIGTVREMARKIF
jgi:hypothetical protein